MEYTFAPLTLTLRNPFRIAHGSSTQRTNVVVNLDGAYGEGALPPYYPYALPDVLEYLEAVNVDALLDGPPWAVDHQLDRLPPGPAPARAALDIALHDRWAQRLDQPLYRLWGLEASEAPPSSVTLSIPDELSTFSDVIRRYASWPILKLKLGAGDPARDEAIVRTAREAASSTLCVDANGAWSVDEAVHLLPRLVEYDLLFIEQPLRTDDPKAWHEMRRQLPGGTPPIIADEAIQGADDVMALRGAIDGINVKLTKSGGLRGARRLIELARALDLQVMLGCMIESAVAVTAAAHLAPLADYADLDGPLHLAEDPFRGAKLADGRLSLPETPGLGVIPADRAAFA